MYAATSLVNDLWLKVSGKKVDGRKLVIVTRVVIVVMTAIAILVALTDVKMIYSFVLYAWGAMGAAFSPMILCMIYVKWFNRWGALTNLLVGPAVVVIWSEIPLLKGAVYELVPAFILSLVLGLVVSLMTQNEETA